MRDLRTLWLRPGGNYADQLLALRKGRVSFALRGVWWDVSDLFQGVPGLWPRVVVIVSKMQRTVRLRMPGIGSCGEFGNGPRGRVETALGPFPWPDEENVTLLWWSSTPLRLFDGHEPYFSGQEQPAKTRRSAECQVVNSNNNGGIPAMSTS